MRRQSLIIFLLFALSALLCSGCAEPVKYVQKWTPAPPPSETVFSVKTDYSGLTRFTTQKSLYSRVSDGPLTQLIPSDGYTLVLPYASAAVTGSGRLQASKFGLVTIDGIVLTDLIYDSIQRAYSSELYKTQPMPAYTLSVNIPDSDDRWFPERLHAVCALDGSWVTPFEYQTVVYADKHILLVRSYESYDVDLYDYNGNFLYNLLDLNLKDKLSSDAWPGEVVHSVSDGYLRGRLADGTFAFIDIETGAFIYTDYTDVDMFYEGLAAVAVEVSPYSDYRYLWGFVDKNLKIVIEPKYIHPAVFSDGCAITETPDGAQHIINKRGEALLSLNGDIIYRNYDGSGYTIHDKDWNVTEVYSSDLSSHISVSKYGMQGYVQSIGGGWHFLQSEGADTVLLFSFDKEYSFSGVSTVSQVAGEYVVCFQHNAHAMTSSMGVITLDGTEVLPSEENSTISAITDSSGRVSFMVTTYPEIFFGEPDYRPSRYKILSEDGDVVLSGYGSMLYDDATGLYSILAEDSYTYLDSGLNVLVRIPMMSYMMD